MQVQGSVLPALAKLALDGDAGIRDTAQAGMVLFAAKAGSVAVLDKVRRRGRVCECRGGAGPGHAFLCVFLFRLSRLLGWGA